MYFAHYGPHHFRSNCSGHLPVAGSAVISDFISSEILRCFGDVLVQTFATVINDSSEVDFKGVSGISAFLYQSCIFSKYISIFTETFFRTFWILYQHNIHMLFFLAHSWHLPDIGCPPERASEPKQFSCEVKPAKVWGNVSGCQRRRDSTSRSVCQYDCDGKVRGESCVSERNLISETMHCLCLDFMARKW